MWCDVNGIAKLLASAGSGLGDKDSGFRIQGLVIRVEGPEFRIRGLGSSMQGEGFGLFSDR